MLAGEEKQRNSDKKKKMNMELLPSEIIIDILSRLPVGSVTNCKCVCKWWLKLIETRELAKSHLCNSVPGIALAVLSRFGRPISSCQIVEFTDVLDINHRRSRLELNTITNLQFPNTSYVTLRIWGSTDGLLLLRRTGYNMSGSIYVCNPITREYIDLNCSDNDLSTIITYGFGKSKETSKYKVVMFLHTSSRVSKYECKVYTVGIESWRSIACDTLFNYEDCRSGAFVNGNLHWLPRYLNGSQLISCFDLETELFTTYSVPLPASGSTTSHKQLCALEGCLCLCFDTYRNKTEIWLMNEYGVEKSWTKKFVISRSWIGLGVVVPFKVFRNGDILLSCENVSVRDGIYYYYSKNKTIRTINTAGVSYTPVLHVSSFLSLKSFVTENTISY